MRAGAYTLAERDDEGGHSMKVEVVDMIGRVHFLMTQGAVGLVSAEPEQARAMALWLLKALAPADPSPGRYCSVCRFSLNSEGTSWCTHPAVVFVDPVTGKAAMVTANSQRCCMSACGPLGDLWMPKVDPAPIPPLPSMDNPA